MTNLKPTPKWKQFEKFVEKIQKSLTPNADVKHNEFIFGKSGIKRQVDISIKYNLGQFDFLVAIDAKDWKNPVDINDVDAFYGLVEDISANKSAIVCNAGFTDGALRRAKEKGVDLLMVADAESKDWPVYMGIPTMCDFRKIENYKFTIKYTGSKQIKIPTTDPRYLEIYNKDGKLIDIISNLVRKAWNENRFPNDPGEYNNLNFIEHEPYFKIDDKIYGPFKISVNIIVVKSLYVGEIPIEKGKGFKNMMSGGFVTNKIETGHLNFAEVERNWKKIENEKDLAIKPVLTFFANDYY